MVSLNFDISYASQYSVCNDFAQTKGEKLNEGPIQQLVRDVRKRNAREFCSTCRDDEQTDHRLSTAATATPM